MDLLLDVVKFSIDDRDLWFRIVLPFPYPAVNRDLAGVLDEPDIAHVRLRGSTVAARPGKVEAPGLRRGREGRKGRKDRERIGRHLRTPSLSIHQPHLVDVRCP